MDGFMLHPFLIGIREIVSQGPINPEKKDFWYFKGTAPLEPFSVYFSALL
jgi:hypothetical protein